MKKFRRKGKKFPKNLKSQKRMTVHVYFDYEERVLFRKLYREIQKYTHFACRNDAIPRYILQYVDDFKNGVGELNENYTPNCNTLEELIETLKKLEGEYLYLEVIVPENNAILFSEILEQFGKLETAIAWS